MNPRDFYQQVTRGVIDLVQLLLNSLAENQTPYCVIGGLAVNAYTEPVVSLDLNIVVVAPVIDALCEKLKANGIKIDNFGHSRKLMIQKSDLRVQIQMDGRYQDFIDRSREKEVLGYRMQVASLEDVLQGKLWAYRDESRRQSKRQKDLADIFRLVETAPELIEKLPKPIRDLI